jgi:ferric-dicitrate binding protein FerR (iron transport regulator)
MNTSSRGAAAASVYATTTRQQAKITLADGSHVVLAPRSRLSVIAGYGAAARTVQLTGEAYFDVDARAKAPFVVHTGAVVTRVLGTSFTVRQYQPNDAVTVGVISGKVMSSGQTGSVTLTAGMQGEVTDSTAVTTTGPIGANVGWINGVLIFTNTPVPDMLATLERWYGYQFRLTDTSLTHARVTTSFSIGAAAKTMTALRDLLDVTIETHGDVLTLSPRRRGNGGVRSSKADARSPLSNPKEAGK